MNNICKKLWSTKQCMAFFLKLKLNYLSKMHGYPQFSFWIPRVLTNMKECYMQCGVWNQMKIWSSHLLDNLSNCLMNLKNSFDFKHRTAYNILSYDIPFTGKQEPNKLTCSPLCAFIAQLVRALHRHRRGHGFESRWVTWIFQVHETIAKLSSKCEDHIFIWVLTKIYFL